MESSPLTQQGRPSIFQPKIDRLYEQLLSTGVFLIEIQDENDQFQLSDGFWQEFFLLRPDKSSLQPRLEWTSADDLLHLQVVNCSCITFRILLILKLAESNTAALPESGWADQLQKRDIRWSGAGFFLNTVLAKRYTNPSSEIITVLAGLDEVDDIFLDFANAIENYIQDLDTPSHIFEPFLLLGLLANYNKFEFRNPYRSRLEDFVNEAAIQQIIRGFGAVCSRSRDKYVAIQEDIEEGWTLSSTLKYIGLGVLAPSRSSTPTPNPPSNTEGTKDPFAI
ncbi:MAG: hypothetical protein Q9177_005735, partial [Variospora cf. flavescens]